MTALRCAKITQLGFPTWFSGWSYLINPMQHVGKIARHASSPCIHPPLYHVSLSVLKLDSEIGHGTFFDQWGVSKHDTSKGLKSTAYWGCASCHHHHHHLKKPKQAYWMMKGMWSRDPHHPSLWLPHPSSRADRQLTAGKREPAQTRKISQHLPNCRCKGVWAE